MLCRIRLWTWRSGADSGVHGVSLNLRDGQCGALCETDEQETAREAVAEGQAMAVVHRLHAALDGTRLWPTRRELDGPVEGC